MKIPFKPYKAEDADIFTIDAIHQKYWKDFCDVCYPLFEFERIEDGERSYEQKYDTFRMCHTMAIDYFKWNEKIVFKVGEQDFKRFKDAYDLFISLSTADKASIPMLLVLFRMQQSIWDRLRKDRLMMEYIYPRECNINFGQYEIDHLEHFPEDENTIHEIDEIDKFICDKLASCRDYDEMWAKAFEDFEIHHSDEYQGEPIEWDSTVGDLVSELADNILHSYNYSLHEFIHKYSEIVKEGKGDVVKAIVYRLFLSYQSSLLEIKKVFEDYPAQMCMSKLELRRQNLIEEFKHTKLGAHWYECILLPDGLEKVGKFLMNHRDVITIDDEAQFFHLLDEICIITDILRGNTKKYWLNVEFDDSESIQCQNKEYKNSPHQVNPIVDAIMEQTEQDNPPSPLNSISPFTPAVIDTTIADAVIALLCQLMEGKTKPKDVLMPARAAMEAGVIRRPTWEEFCQEFGSYRLKSKTSFSDYTNPDKSPYTGADFQMMKEKFRQLMSDGQ